MIINKPNKKIKGFNKNNFYLNTDKIDTRSLSPSLELIKKNLLKLNLSDEDSDILKKIIVQDNLTSIDNDFNLTDHELLEILKVPESKLHRYLIYRYKYKIYPQKKILGKYPPCVQIEPTSMCNYRCIMCYQKDKSFSLKSNNYMGHMKLDLFKEIIDQLDGNIEAITFASRGEPTLNKHFISMLKYCDKKFLALKINTNASTLNENLIHELLSSGLQTIVFSIDSVEKENYEKIRVNGSFEKILKNLNLFNKIKEEHYSKTDKIIRISGVKIHDEQNIKDMSQKWREFADIVAFTNYTPWESSYENDINDVVEPCSELWLRMFIWYDGKINPCDYDYKSLLSKQNVIKNQISNIWNSNYYNSLREIHLNKKRSSIEPCKRCINY